ncbi:hypothetical protein RRX38_20855 [Pseudomonas sp. DTU_2021_1001937_2_SI_NGA_ILE_001]|uniref:hypothetical protein n=1 Tax=Pseudomonas sp. DTU_2021_1001937_2_SI_NGA_ILE_001 TaxID=3077589 RepID=UPI0025F7AB56|nr:hypothetical protein [Pseudomonas sp. DTU_2021_1001937_2_SI_NGA_ILE_001]WNW13503.1 hypothetical protein RRX38_20855 [Pseudomonas sp. DTU_2021_1001937_2_SI_NGA_ILE_001]
MQADSLLTQDELDFILDMQHNPKLNVRDNTQQMSVNGGERIQRLLARLAAHEQVTIQAQFNNQQMTFPLQLVEDEFHAQHLELGTPSIYEDGPQVRPWRLALPAPVPLENLRGARTALWVHDISFKGVLLEYRRPGTPPQRFSAWLRPAGRKSIALRGRFERLTDQGLAAYRLSQNDPLEAENLRQYLLDEHRKANPSLYA